MPASTKRTYARYTTQALSLLGRQIRLGRKQRRMTVAELATRTGVSRGMMQRIEKGDPKVQVGAIFEAGVIVGLKFFDEDLRGITASTVQADDRIAVLPKYIRRSEIGLDDDF